MKDSTQHSGNREILVLSFGHGSTRGRRESCIQSDSHNTPNKAQNQAIVTTQAISVHIPIEVFEFLLRNVFWFEMYFGLVEVIAKSIWEPKITPRILNHRILPSNALEIYLLSPNNKTRLFLPTLLSTFYIPTEI